MFAGLFMGTEITPGLGKASRARRVLILVLRVTPTNSAGVWAVTESRQTSEVTSGGEDSVGNQLCSPLGLSIVKFGSPPYHRALR